MTLILRQPFFPTPSSQPFYSPKIPHPHVKDFRKLIPLVKSIGEKQLEIVGCSYVQNIKTKKWNPIVITQEPFKGIFKMNSVGDWRTFSVYHLQDEAAESIGYATVFFRDIRGEPKRIYLAEIANEKIADFKYTGYLLIKAIQQVFEETCKGRMYLNAACSERFYEKLGFVTTHKPYMELTPEAEKNWLNEINCNPLSLPAKSCCHIL